MPRLAFKTTPATPTADCVPKHAKEAPTLPNDARRGGAARNADTHADWPDTWDVEAERKEVCNEGAHNVHVLGVIQG